MCSKPSIPAFPAAGFSTGRSIALVRNLIADAARAASGGNLQPWQVYALTGAALVELKGQVAQAIAGGDPRHVDAEYPIYPKTM